MRLLGQAFVAEQNQNQNVGNIQRICDQNILERQIRENHLVHVKVQDPATKKEHTTVMKKKILKNPQNLVNVA